MNDDKIFFDAPLVNLILFLTHLHKVDSIKRDV